MVDNVTGFALAGVLGAAAVRQLRRGEAPDGSGARRAGTMESLLGGLGRGVGAVAASGVRTTTDVAGAAVRTAGRVSASTLERGIPVTTATSGWLLDGVGGLVAGTGRGLLGAASRLPHLAPGSAAAPVDASPVIGLDPTGPVDAAAVGVVDPAAVGVVDPAGGSTDVVLVVRQAPGARFHRRGCRMVGDAAQELDRDEALAAGMTSCGICGP